MALIYSFNTGHDLSRNVVITKNWMWGSIQVTVDGQKIQNKLSVVGGTKQLNFAVDDNVVNITINIPVFLGAYLAWEYIITVDGYQLAHFKK